MTAHAGGRQGGRCRTDAGARGVHLTHEVHPRDGASRHAAADERARRARRSSVQREGRAAAGQQRDEHGGRPHLWR